MVVAISLAKFCATSVVKLTVNCLGVRTRVSIDLTANWAETETSSSVSCVVGSKVRDRISELRLCGRCQDTKVHEDTNRIRCLCLALRLLSLQVFVARVSFTVDLVRVVFEKRSVMPSHLLKSFFD